MFGALGGNDCTDKLAGPANGEHTPGRNENRRQPAKASTMRLKCFGNCKGGKQQYTPWQKPSEAFSFSSILESPTQAKYLLKKRSSKC